MSREKRSARASDQCSECHISKRLTLVACVRCDAEYHLHCIQPPLSRRPRNIGNWVCWKCMAQPEQENNSRVRRSTRLQLAPRIVNETEDSDFIDKAPARIAKNTSKRALQKSGKRKKKQKRQVSSDDDYFPPSESDDMDDSPEPPIITPIRAIEDNMPTMTRRDSLELDPLTITEALDKTSYPRYKIGYSENNRSKCKSCGVRIRKQELRVSVEIINSTFGLMTYYKHLKCTQICWKSNDTDQSPIMGFSELNDDDRRTVQEYMIQLRDSQQSDERMELTETDFCIKERLEERSPCKYLVASLLPYQREALGWMINQEKSLYRGGILADEMGMGKTLQTISLILEKTRLTKAASVKDFKQVIGGTLVVCPVVAVTQWKIEIERFVQRNYLSIYVHHGGKRISNVPRIASYDIVLTTYSIIEFEIRSILGLEKVACQYCSKKFVPERLVFHNKYFCGPNAQKTARQKKQKRGKHFDDDTDSQSLPKPSNDLRGDIKDVTPKKKEKDAVRISKKSPLHSIFWTRIVLDEAHYIKDRRCNTARAAFNLQARYRWCLTGTPLQNRIGELFSLLRFLQIEKYAFYHCNLCDCKILDFTMEQGSCTSCSHRSTAHYSYFNKHIVIPIQAYGYVAEGKLAMLRLQNDILQHVLLRRTKISRADDICLPPKLVRVRKDEMDEREKDFYEAIYTQSQATFNTYVSSGTLLNNYAHIFDLLMRLRQAVDHPYLVIYSKSNPALQHPQDSDGVFTRPIVQEEPYLRPKDDDAISDKEFESVCGFCHEEAENSVTAICSHSFCKQCAEYYMSSLLINAVATCPTCNQPLTLRITQSVDEEAEKETELKRKSAMKKYKKTSIMHRIGDINTFQTSTKIEALLQELHCMKETDPSGKAIVFSQFVNMLDIIHHRLGLCGIKCVQLSGHLSLEARDRYIQAFQEDSTITVFLISLKAGGVALNLTIASHIYLMDVWWNPAAESQAIDRTHRLGQFKPVRATRFIISGTIEERIVKLQEKKQLIFEGTVGAHLESLVRLTEEDLRFLFSK